MKSFKDISIQDEYRTYTTNIIRDFYIPVLSCSVLYQRAVGFFSSSSMIQLLEGLQSLIKNEGKIQLIVSPRLNEKDIEAISQGYSSRETVIEKSMLEIIEDVKSRGYDKRLILLSKLIEQGYVDIKVAFLQKNNNIGMFHEKLGIMNDFEGNYLAFSGSLNESETAYTINYESFDVFKSWLDSESKKAKNKKDVFEKMWANLEEGINVLDFPKVAKEKLQKITQDYISKNGDFDLDEGFVIEEPSIVVKGSNVPMVPKELEIRDYQQAAIDNWMFNDYVGIFDMATGAGKTITGIYGLTTLFNNMRRLPVIIVAPYTHLVEQWVEDLEWFNIRPIVGYSHSLYKNYKKNLNDRLTSFKYKKTDFICFITTNASFRTKSVQDLIDLFPDETLIIIDEAHNFGSKRLKVSLPTRFKFRMALSATIDRHNDEEGTEFLYEYFGSKVIEYTLERAIREDKLSEYKYYPIMTYLSEDEYYSYKQLTFEIAKHIREEKGKIKISEIGKMLLLKRSRIIAGASNKIDRLIEVIAPFKDADGILIYSGATNLLNDQTDEEEIRMIDLISTRLYGEYGMLTSQFTAQEDKLQRKRIIDYFVERYIQAIVAIKCLDEGVNIPSIKTAFILASSTNPKEYVQRRGRVLRKHKSKDYSEIFDFIVMPHQIEYASQLTDEEKIQDYGLIKRELIRVHEFSKLSLNSSLGFQFMQRILNAYPGIKFEEIVDANKKGEEHDYN
jgi:superfamily II DNA or RNA helicase